MNTKQQVSKKGKIKFIIGALLGAFLFLAPIPTGAGTFNIPLGLVIDWLNVEVLNAGEGLSDIRIWLAYSFIIVSFVATVVAYVFKPAFIMNNPKLKEVLLTSPLYAVTRLIAFIVMTMVIFDVTGGPVVWWMEGTPTFAQVIIDPWDGGGLMVFELISGLTTIFLVLAFAIPILTDFGLMEFIGVLIKRFVNKLFKLPGRASVDLAASWFGSSAVSVIITRDQHEKGFYTGREAATICANFAFVSLPFSLVVASHMGLESHFALWYLMICIVCVILGVITPRLWPLKSLPDTYAEGVEKAIDEDLEGNETRFQKATRLASERAEKTTASDVVVGGLNAWLTSFLDLFPVVVGWGTVALVLNNITPVLEIISLPMGLLLELFNVPGGADWAHITLIGFIDMFLPAVFLGTSAPFETRFILGALSIVQIIYMAETGVLILKSKMPLGFGKLVVIFLIRTLLGLPIIVGLTWIITQLGWIG